MASFKSTQILRSSKVGEVENPEARYWSRFKSPMVRYEQSSVTHIDYSARKGHFCATTGFRIVLCDYTSGATVKQLTRFSNRVYGGALGRQGELLACGSDDGVVLALSASSGVQLRAFRGHGARVRTVGWATDGLAVVSGSDDRTVRVWDVAAAQQTAVFDCFRDSVRCVAVTGESGLVLAGAYDHLVRVLDMRAGGKAVAEMDCGAPVEALCAFEQPAPFAFAAASGNAVRTFDLRTRQPLAAACAHHKSVTALAFAPSVGALEQLGVRSQSSMRLFSASLDGHVRIYDAATLTPTFKFAYSSAVLSLQVGSDDGLIVGMQNGLITLQRRAQRVSDESEGPSQPQPQSQSQKRAQDDEQPDEDAVRKRNPRKLRAPKKLQGTIVDRVDDALFRAMTRQASSAQLDAIFAELTGASAKQPAKDTKADADADADEAVQAAAANQDRLDELVLRGTQHSRRSRWDVLLARFEQRKCFELVFGKHFDWLNRRRPELIFCIVRELLRRNVLRNCLRFRSRPSPSSDSPQTRLLTPTRSSATAERTAERDETLLRNVLSFLAAHANEVRYERVLLALCNQLAALPNLPLLLARGGKRTRGLFRNVRNTLLQQLDFVKQAHAVCGMIDTLLCDAASRAHPVNGPQQSLATPVAPLSSHPTRV